MGIKLPTWVFGFGICISLLLVFSCEREEGCLDAAASNFQPGADKDCCCEYPLLQLRVFRKAGLADFSQDSTYMDMAGNSYKIKTARIIISNLRIRKADGTEVGVTDTIAISLQNGGTKFVQNNFARLKIAQNLYDLGNIQTHGDFTKLVFTVGLDEDVNHSNPLSYPVGHALAIQADTMFINQEEGFRFQYMEIETDGQIVPLQISGDSRKMEVVIDYPVKVVKAFDVEIRLDIDLVNMLDGVDFSSDSSAEIEEKILANTASSFSLHQ